MLKCLSVRTKITLWFCVFLIAAVVVTYAVVLSVSDQVIQKGVRDSLVETVADNVDEVEYYTDIDQADVVADIDFYVRYGEGFLEVDDDFLDEVNGIYTSLCLEDATLVYGENPIPHVAEEIEFSDGELQRVSVDGTTYYVYDRKLTDEGLEGLWLRGIVSEEEGAVQMNSISRLSLIALPSLVLLAIVGGYLMARRALAPVGRLSQAAEHIRQGNDLKQRIDVGEGRDELHQLAGQFNQMFERLDSSFTAQQQFVSDASHELRTPLSVITAQCELALEEPPAGDAQGEAASREALEVVQRQAQRMSRLVDDMLDVTRLELHAERYDVEDVDLTQLVEDVCEDMALIRQRDIQLACEAQPGVHVRGNHQLLSRMLANLVSNAYRYGIEGGHIWVKLLAGDPGCSAGVGGAEGVGAVCAVALEGVGVEDGETVSVCAESVKGAKAAGARAAGAKAAGAGETGEANAAQWATLSVADDGIGIAAEDLPHVFDRFYQVDTSRAGEGSGLGLAMVAEIAQFHGGDVEATSTLGKGTTFTVTFGDAG